MPRHTTFLGHKMRKPRKEQVYVLRIEEKFGPATERKFKRFEDLQWFIIFHVTRYGKPDPKYKIIMAEHDRISNTLKYKYTIWPATKWRKPVVLPSLLTNVRVG